MVCSDPFGLRLCRLVILAVALASPARAFSPATPIVFFSYNSSELEPGQRDELIGFVTTYGKNGVECFEAIAITGHTDTAEPAAEAPTAYAIPAGADLLSSIPKGLVRAHLAGRVSGGEFERLSSAPREVIVRGSDVTVRAIKVAKPATAKAPPQVAPKPTPTPQAAPKAPGFTLTPRAGAGRAVATARRARRSHA